MKYRCRHDIIADILKTALAPARISQIAFKANLPLDRARRHVERLVERGLLAYNPMEGTYSATELAYEWLALYEKLRLLYDPG
ncbi:MAG: winged helix-turn-helix domain-containing protein [Desulfurococcales archaeon]|nr:winged helix-turn-helix domain-containing protein [Desulfurococcales archaeon]